MENRFHNTDHPCFSGKAAARFGRVHLPVAPRCNIRCNYCNRLYDCPNEGRPGVTSRVMDTGEALDFLERAMAMGPISVAGVAGPGDPLANPRETFAALELVREAHPDLLRCLSTNGLALPEHIDEVVSLASHVTVTVNAVDEAVGSKVYRWVNTGDRVYRSREAAAALVERQLKGIQRLKEAGLVVKVNTVVVPGVNEGQVPVIASVMKDLGVDLYNAMPLFPVAGTPFAGLPEPGRARMRELRKAAGSYLPQMTHCARCRADAAGMIGTSQKVETRCG